MTLFGLSVKWKNRFLLQNFSHLIQSATLPDCLYHWQFTLTHCALHFTGKVSTTSCRNSPRKANAWRVPSRKLCTPQKHSLLPSTLLKYPNAFLHFWHYSSIFKIWKHTHIFCSNRITTAITICLLLTSLLFLLLLLWLS